MKERVSPLSIDATMEDPRRRLSLRRRRGERGVTLIELMVGIFVAAILAVFIYRVLIDQNIAYRRQDEMTRLQQNLRFAMEFVGRSVEMAGYGTYGWTTGTGKFPSIEVIDGGTSAPDQLQVLFADPSRLAITKWGNNVSCATTFIPLQNDQAAFDYKDASHMLCYSYINSSRLNSFLLDVVSYDLSKNEVEVVTPVGTTLFDSECSGNFPPDMLCAPANWFIFYVDNQIDAGGGPGTPTKPMLMLRESSAPLNGTAITPSSNDSVLAEGIEHMNVELCMDGAMCSTSELWNTTLDSTTNTALVRQIRLTLWAASDRVSETSTLYANPLTGAVDRKFRVSSTTSILVRNMKRLADYN